MLMYKTRGLFPHSR